jgi:type IV pilus assembly protein PilW
MNTVQNRLKHYRGFTLIELIIAMVIGLVVILGISSVYLGNRQTYTTTNAVSRLQEQTRYAAMIVRESIMHAGYFGRIENAVIINGRFGAGGSYIGDIPDDEDDCADGWYVDLSNAIEAPDTSGGNPFSATCLRGNTYARSLLPNTDLLTIRRVSNATAPDTGTAQNSLTNAATQGFVFIRSDINRAEAFINNGTPPAGYNAATVQNNQLLTEMFFVSPDFNDLNDGIPTLRRLRLGRDSGTPYVDTERVMSGVEQFQVQIGADVDGDGIADVFDDPPNADASRAVAVRFWLLIRSETMERDYIDTNTYTMGDVTFTPTGDLRNYRRNLVTQTVSLRNF